MHSTRIVPRSHAALVIAVCVGLVSPALTWADNPTDRPLVSSSVPERRASAAYASDAPVAPTADSGDSLTQEQIQEAADELLSGLGSALQSLVFTMLEWDLPTTPLPPPPPPTPPPPPDTFVPLGVQPPPSLTDDPGNGPPPPPPPPPHQSPEPGTLIAALAGAGAIVYRYRRRRVEEVRRDEKEQKSEKEVELAM